MRELSFYMSKIKKVKSYLTCTGRTYNHTLHRIIVVKYAQKKEKKKKRRVCYRNIKN